MDVGIIQPKNIEEQQLIDQPLCTINLLDQQKQTDQLIEQPMLTINIKEQHNQVSLCIIFVFNELSPKIVTN